jgi:hypothetical protein
MAYRTTQNKTEFYNTSTYNINKDSVEFLLIYVLPHERKSHLSKQQKHKWYRRTTQREIMAKLIIIYFNSGLHANSTVQGQFRNERWRNKETRREQSIRRLVITE